MRGRGPMAGAALLCALAACGCATREVVSADREALWRAALQAAQEEGFRLEAADAVKGQIVSVRTGYDERGLVAARERMTVDLERAGQVFRARVTVRRSSGEASLPEIEGAKRYDRRYSGGTGRVVGEYGQSPRRDARREAATLERIRRLLETGAPPAEPAEAAPEAPVDTSAPGP